MLCIWPSPLHVTLHAASNSKQTINLQIQNGMRKIYDQYGSQKCLILGINLSGGFTISPRPCTIPIYMMSRLGYT